MPNAVGIVQPNSNMGGARGPRPLDQVTCYKVRVLFDFMHVLALYSDNNFFNVKFNLFASLSVVKRAIMQTNALKDTWLS